MIIGIKKHLVFLIGLFSLMRLCKAQEEPYHTKPINCYIDIDGIKSIEIYNEWSHKRWTLNTANLVKLKSILKKSSVMPYLPVKPGHMYIKIKGSTDLSHYFTYISNGGIFFDGYSDPKNKVPVFTITLFKEIDWNKTNLL